MNSNDELKSLDLLASAMVLYTSIWRKNLFRILKRVFYLNGKKDMLFLKILFSARNGYDVERVTRKHIQSESIASLEYKNFLDMLTFLSSSSTRILDKYPIAIGQEFQRIYDEESKQLEDKVTILATIYIFSPMILGLVSLFYGTANMLMLLFSVFLGFTLAVVQDLIIARKVELL